MQSLSHLKHSPLEWVPSLYFAMGLPFVVLNMVSAVLYKDLGISDAQIAFWTSLIMWPWTIKFLWSPFLELYRTKKFWVVGSQLLSGVLFGVAALSLHLPLFFSVSVAVFAVVAFSGATHDIAADGVYMSELSPASQAKYIGWQGGTGASGDLCVRFLFRVPAGGDACAAVWIAGYAPVGSAPGAGRLAIARMSSVRTGARGVYAAGAGSFLLAYTYTGLPSSGELVFALRDGSGVLRSAVYRDGVFAGYCD